MIEKKGIIRLRFELSGNNTYNYTNTSYYLKLCKGIVLNIYQIDS